MELRNAPAVLPQPTLAEVRLVGDVSAGKVSVLVGGGVSFTFSRDEGEAEVWSGGEALTASRGVPISETWLARARAVAGEALRRALTATEGGDDTVRCEECSRLLCYVEFRGAGEVKHIWCGPEHTVTFTSGRSLTVNGDGTATWWP